ncbi:TonB-dependent siderophore receptor [Shewanella sp. NIFS-20-20]|uniref:TonB-dependent receptor plug domain-containing protein n=1 Tax=Shewanella sp. NIFS-20-20 TaxID=2853806 RepID=UPI001C495227|nr:TonB-dependent receptor [Shewanella sp. NIFS-20-20]MBV7315978.1 TonB-dependent receptor [Shewanella sp. NIFS-20-20]
MKSQPRAKHACALAVLTVMAAPSMAEETIEKIEVTGSHIKRIDLEGASPITVISADDIIKSGAQDVSQLLRKLPISGNGTFSTQGNNSDDTSNGGAAVSLRGLGADATLVLLNGRRIAVNSFAKNIDTAFVDINAIPMSAIKRIDIVKDGASATYGSDAIAGVINIILKKDFEGFEINAKVSDTVEDGGGQVAGSMLWGTQSDKAHTTVILDYFKENETLFGDRDYSNSANQTPNGGSDFRSSAGNPGTYIPATVGADGSILPKSDVFNWTPDVNCPASSINGAFCRFDYAPVMTSIPETSRVGLSVFQTYEFNDELSMFAELMYQHNESVVKGAASPSFGEFYMLADNPLFTSDAAVNPFPGEDITMRRRLTEAGTRKKEAESNSARVVLGLDGMLADWEWQLAYTYSWNRNQEFGTQGFVWTPQLQASINAGEFNPLSQTQSQAVIDDISVQTTRNGKSTTSAFDGKIAGEIFEMPAGAVGMAVGFEYREEKLEDRPDELFRRGQIFGTEATEASGSRDQTSLFAEFGVPLMETLEAQLAVRYENYSDFGNTTTPKIALLFTPTDFLTMRASWGKAFRAPSLVQLGLGSTQESPSLIDNTRCPLTGLEEDCKPVERTVIFSGNPDLQPEKSTSYNFGIVWEITDGLSAGIDYWNYDQTGLITSDTQYLLDNEGNNPAVVKREPAAAGVPGRIIEIYDKFENLGGQTTDGVDFNVNYVMPTASAGDFNFSYNLTWVNSFDQTRADGSKRQLAGEFQHPKFRWVAGMDWNIGDWQTAARLNYIGEFEDSLDAGADRTIDSMATLDVNASYVGFDHWTLTVGGNNLFNEDPPFSEADFMGYDQATHSALGAVVYGSVRYQF